MATVAKRVVVSELQETTATMKSGDFDVKFNYKNIAGGAVTSVQVAATKAGGGYMSYSINGPQTNINFSNMAFDQALLSAVQIEIDDITKEVVE